MSGYETAKYRTDGDTGGMAVEQRLRHLGALEGLAAYANGLGFGHFGTECTRRGIQKGRSKGYCKIGFTHPYPADYYPKAIVEGGDI